MSERSPIFELLNGGAVEGGNNLDYDAEGLIAYALYKHHKRTWCLEYELENKRAPTPKEKLTFAKSVSTPDQLERYLKDAQDLLGEFVGSIIDNERPDIEKDAITTRIEAAAQRIEQQGSFWASVKAGVVSTLISTATIIVLAVGIRLFGIDLLEALGKLSPPIQNGQ